MSQILYESCHSQIDAQKGTRTTWYEHVDKLDIIEKQLKKEVALLHKILEKKDTFLSL